MTQTELLALFVYEPATGMLRRVDAKARKHYPWRGIGRNRRYLAFTCRDRSTLYLHRAVWLYHYGTVPPMLDHIDRDPRNCRVENLRPCTNAQNQFNSARKANNQSGFKGVVYCTGYRLPWQARITLGGEPMLVGRFATKEEAAAAYASALEKYAGEFARAQ